MIVDKKLSFQQRIDIGWYPILEELEKSTGKNFKKLVEAALANTYAINFDGKPYEIKNT